MIVHIALFRWRNEIKKEHVNDIFKKLIKLKKIPGIIDVMCGENFSSHAKGFTHAVVVLGKDKAAVDSYRNHPEHIKIANVMPHVPKGTCVHFRFA